MEYLEKLEKDRNKENNEEENNEEKSDNSQGLILFIEKKEVNEDKREENKNYNDANFWHMDIEDKCKFENILKELE